MKRIFLVLSAAGLIAGTLSCSRQPQVTAENYLDQFIDTSADPREDFHQYAVGKWLAENPIPPSERSWGLGRVVQEEVYERLLSICEEAADNSDAPPGSNAQRIGDFWSTGMDSAAVTEQRIEPLAGEFAGIEAAKSKQDLLDVVAGLHYIGAEAIFSPIIWQDEKNSDRYALYLYQGGLGLPDRDFYFDTDERSTMIRDEYVKHVAKMFELLGDAPEVAEGNARTVMTMETELAGASRELEDLRDPYANYNAMSVAGLSKLAPSIRWRDFFERSNIPGIDSVVVGQPEFFEQVEKTLKRHDLDEWKTYVRWHLIDEYASQAGGDFDTQNFHFFGTILNGTPEQRPRWKRMLDWEEDYLGDALGQLYVERYFSPATKERYENLTREIFDAFRERIKNLDWMSEATKERALRKLDSVTMKVGYPDNWRDYSSYTVDRESFLGNCIRGNAWLSDFYIQKLYKPVDRTEWDMTPQTYNAYYNPSNNEIVMPATVFVFPGIPDSLVDDALVYAYAGGSTIGHEITHGFDDWGRQYDENGNLEDWWTKKDEEEFNRRAKRIVQQFDEYVVVDSLHINGEATQGENIADLGGMLLGWDAFTKTEQYKNNEIIGGFTPAQRYFLGWAVGWMYQIRPENLATRVKTDEHAPSFLRVTGPMSNLPQFYAAFDVQPGDAMYRPDSVRVEIW